MLPAYFTKYFKSDTNKIIFGIVSTALVIFLYSKEIHWFNNTFGIQNLITIGIVGGLLIGVGLGWKWKEYGNDLMEQAVFFILSVFLAVLLVPLLLSLSNRILSPYAIVEEPVEFVEANAFIGSRFGRPKGQASREDGFHIFFIRKNRLERIKTRTNPYLGTQKGEMIALPVKKGLLGFDLVCLK